MELNIKDESKALLLPEKCLKKLGEADAADLKVLLYVAGLRGEELDIASACEALGLGEGEINSSLKFWRGASVIKSASSAQTKKAVKKPLPEKRIMHLTQDEVTAIGEKNAEFRALINLAQQTAGWMFNESEIGIIASVYANLNLSPEYILALIGYYICKKEKNLRYLEKAAYSLVDEGITSEGALEEKLREIEAFEGREGKVRSIFGLGSRKLSTKEKGYLENWFNVYGASDELIALAYEKTVDATGKPSLPYANSILTAWHEQGIKTVEAANAQNKKSPSGGQKGIAQSFDVEDVFNRAISRSYDIGGKE